MISQHSKLARSLGEQLGLPAAALDGAGAVVRAVGRQGLAGRARRRRLPISARIAQLAEFVEVAHRPAASTRRPRWHEAARERSSIPTVARCCRRREGILERSRRDEHVGRGDRRGAGARRCECRPTSSTRAGRGRRLRRSQVALHARSRRWPSSELVAATGARLGLAGDGPDDASPGGRRARLGRSGSRTPSGTSAGPLGAGRVGTGAHAALPNGTHAAQSPVARTARRIAVQLRERLDGRAIPAACPAERSRSRRGSSARRTRTRRCGAAPHRAALRRPTTPPTQLRAELHAPGDSTATPSRRYCDGRPSGRARRKARPASRPARSTCSACRAGLSTRDRDAARDLAEDRPEPHRAHLREDRRVQPGDREPVRDAARAAPGRTPGDELTQTQRWGNCPMRRDALRRYLRPRIEARRSEATMSIRGRLFAPTYNRQIAKTEKAGLRRSAPTTARGGSGDVLEVGAGTGPTCPSTAPRSSR